MGNLGSAGHLYSDRAMTWLLKRGNHIAAAAARIMEVERANSPVSEDVAHARAACSEQIENMHAWIQKNAYTSNAAGTGAASVTVGNAGNAGFEEDPWACWAGLRAMQTARAVSEIEHLQLVIGRSFTHLAACRSHAGSMRSWADTGMTPERLTAPPGLQNRSSNSDGDAGSGFRREQHNTTDGDGFEDDPWVKWATAQADHLDGLANEVDHCRHTSSSSYSQSNLLKCYSDPSIVGSCRKHAAELRTWAASGAQSVGHEPWLHTAWPDRGPGSLSFAPDNLFSAERAAQSAACLLETLGAVEQLTQNRQPVGPALTATLEGHLEMLKAWTDNPLPSSTQDPLRLPSDSLLDVDPVVAVYDAESVMPDPLPSMNQQDGQKEVGLGRRMGLQVAPTEAWRDRHDCQVVK